MEGVTRLTELEPGTVQITAHSAGWHLVEIGRQRRTKRFNLSTAEARRLLDALQIELGEI